MSENAEIFIRLLVAEVKRLEVVAQTRANEITQLKRQLVGPDVVRGAPPEAGLIVTSLAPNA